MNPLSMQRHRSGQRGMTLIEVLVAMIVLSFGMISFAGLQAVSIKQGKMAQYRTVASQLASDYVDRMRANSALAAAGGYNFVQAYAALDAALPLPGCAVAVCTPAEVRDIDQVQWRNNARASLPGGSLYAVMDAAAPVAPIIDFWVVWRDPDAGDELDIGQTCPDLLGVAIDGPRCMHFRIAL